MTEDNIHQNHRKRLKNRYAEKGLSSFEDHNVLELLLFYAIPRKDTNEIGHRLMRKFGSFSAVLDADISELAEVEGMGENSALLLKLMVDVAKRYMSDKQNHTFLNNSETAGKFVVPLFIGSKEESVYMLSLDAKAKLIKCDHINDGSFNAVEINVRKMAKTALKCNAAGVIIAHNHPGGVALPSPEDNEATRRVKEALASLGIELYDHIIVADGDYVSYADTYPEWIRR